MGSKKYRKVLTYVKIDEKFHQNLPVVKSFFKTTSVMLPESKCIISNISQWNTYRYPNRFKVFLLKYYHNLLGTGNRVFHFNEEAEVCCIFCSKNGLLPAPIESFSHVFYDCPIINRIIVQYIEKYFTINIDRTMYFNGDFATNN